MCIHVQTHTYMVSSGNERLRERAIDKPRVARHFIVLPFWLKLDLAAINFCVCQTTP